MMNNISKINLKGTSYDIKDKLVRDSIGVPSSETSLGIAPLDASGKVPSENLPSYVDDVIEGYYNNGAFYNEQALTTQITPETGKIYVDKSTNKTYRYGSSLYVIVSNGDGAITTTINKTWAQLKAMRDNSQLIPGQWYRITDFVTTTALEETQSAGHPFDIIVIADANNKLNENAYAAIHSGDTYFANSKLEAWKLKYALDNDSSLFTWADKENGKGVIYEMEDEFGNKCAYDFKNMLFKRCKTTKSGAFYNNLYFGATNAMGDELPYGATLDKNDYKYLYTFTAYTSNYAQIKDASLNNGDSGVTCYQNVIPACNDPFGDYYGIPGYIPNNIVFQGQGNFYNNSFGAGCSYNTIGNGFESNTIGNSFNNNTIGNSFGGNIIGNSFGGNTIGNSFNNNTIGNSFWYNTIGNSFGGNTIGNYFQFNTIGNSFWYNTIGNDCNNFTIGKDYVRYIEIEDGNKYFTLTSTQTTSSSNYLQNICISRGFNNTSITKTISHNTVNDDFQTEYKATNSQTIVL